MKWWNRRYIQGEAKAARIASDLVRMSVWFEVEPYPDDFWAFEVKPEAVHRLEDLSLDFRMHASETAPTRREAMELLA